MTALARMGVFAHGVVVSMVGYSIFRTGLHANPRELAGTSGALRTVQRAGGGTALFALVAAGLIAYGVSLLVLAVSRRRAAH
jgi:Zn-dependent protease with chaperone function